MVSLGMMLHLLKLATLLYLVWCVTAILAVLSFAVFHLRGSQPPAARASQPVDVVCLTPSPED